MTLYRHLHELQLVDNLDSQRVPAPYPPLNETRKRVNNSVAHAPRSSVRSRSYVCPSQRSTIVQTLQDGLNCRLACHVISWQQPSTGRRSTLHNMYSVCRGPGEALNPFFFIKTFLANRPCDHRHSLRTVRMPVWHDGRITHSSLGFDYCINSVLTSLCYVTLS